ncbi:MAG: cysteine--tRNA ligase [Leptolyngbya sp. PLA2]|nr:cysteine--tRNA ligase [Leptolyngbya sp.]MCE7971468.1 cysteine--tRNA ligase [Leptolyngbya sp. PL-A2]MCQ3940683.1 cysteine--tRNA ligase [cyanobacterium CYA1]MCZ7632321.1 cysteine--tRNA ligase [Phycisphaerales bacterium]MDL1903652.1 cysteine--tRNA ligase [Synechococcales cyanobacterium CNB]GIK18403.1 MAG: cysteine--tRNA ligase [Planctomycetota bacterium]
MPLRLYNTLAKRVEPFVPADPTRITFYSCGPTVYDDAHIGNFRSFLAADLLRRWLESPLCRVARAPDDAEGVPGPRQVVQVMNITDVGHMTDDASADGGGEDKMQAAARRLAEAKKAGKLPPGASVDPNDPYAIAAFYVERFKEDARRLGLRVVQDADRDPTLMPRATRSVPGMIAMIERLIAKGHAYAVGPAGRQTVYFSVQSFPEYGRLSGNTLDRLREGAGERVDAAHQAEKRHPADFLLWKSDPAHVMKWPSPWGEGYPGWHVECSVMALARLDPDHARGEIDLHSGGEDNIFPHHECEIAQSCAFTGNPLYARAWFHPRFLLVEGEKMSKSKGNFFTARDLFARGHEPAAVRLELIRTHYRSNANFTEQGLKDSARFVVRWRRFADEASAATDAGAADERITRDFAAAMHDDLNIAGAIGSVNEWIGRTPRPTRADADTMRTLDAVLGLLALDRAEARATDLGVFVGVDPSPEVESLLRERAEARRARDFARADSIRDRLAEMGYAIKDAPGGKVEVRRA